MAAWLSLLPLALTSTAWSIRKLGGKNWNRPAHAHLSRRSLWSGSLLVADEARRLTPLVMTVVIARFLLVRPILAWLQRRKARAAS